MTNSAAVASAATKNIIHVAGYSGCGFYRRAASVVASLSLLFPHKLQLVQHEFNNRDEFRDWLIHGSNNFRDKVGNSNANIQKGGGGGTLRATSHSSSPFCWMSCSADKSNDVAADSVLEFIGGCDDTLDWCRKFAQPSAPPSSTAMTNGSAESNNVAQM